ncbi:MFS transporter [Aliiroseovarius sp. 2305UL8-7]|uniref:MFS transporter n=1 Tax=Aliiroseovarius conchicola TaxID=3121637 RepID=UPI0035281A97
MFDKLYARVAGTPDHDNEAHNGMMQAFALACTRFADGLTSPQLVLAWLMSLLGVPVGMIGALAPIREAGALLPQAFVAAELEKRARRGHIWVAATVVLGVMVFAVAITASTAAGQTAGWIILGCVVAFALARSVFSVASSDMLGKTLGRHRGVVSGIAGTLGSLGVLGFALTLIFGIVQGRSGLIYCLILSGLLFLIAAFFMSRVIEPASPSPSRPKISEILNLLRQDAVLRRFVIARGLLASATLAPPYFVLLGSEGRALSGLGALMLASSLASFLSAYAWGKAADRSARGVLIVSGVLGAGATAGAVVAASIGALWALPFILFVLMVSSHGRFLGRIVFIVALAPADRRASYIAAANTAMGALLILLGTAVAMLANLGVGVALIALAAMALIGAVMSSRLPDVKAAQPSGLRA